MPMFTITLNFGISEKLYEYITVTYDQYIRKVRRAQNSTQFRVEAPDEAALQVALQDIKQRLVEIDPEV